MGTFLVTQKMQPGIVSLETKVKCIHFVNDVLKLPCLRGMDATAVGIRGIVVETKEEPSRIVPVCPVTTGRRQG